MTTTPSPLDGPHMTSTRITDSSDDPGFSLHPVLKPGCPDAVAWTFARLGYSTRDDEKAA